MARHRSNPPRVVVLAGPNGAGKSTAAPRLLRDTLAVDEFVNADVIAQGISGFNSSAATLAAGRIMLERLKELAMARATFAFETTLASRTFAPWLKELIAGGYQLQLVFLWLPNAEMAIARVQERVRMGGHDVPENVIRRRYQAGLHNFFRLYQPLAASWRFLDNTVVGEPSLIAAGVRTTVVTVGIGAIWELIVNTWNPRNGGHRAK
jgi:predicted ABC-type ATPase